MKRKLEGTWCVFLGVSIIMLFFSNLFYKLWLGSRIEIDWSLSFCMAVYMYNRYAGRFAYYGFDFW